MSLSFPLRVIFVTIIRFIGLVGLLIWYQNFEVSPLPAWTLTAFLFLLQGLWTFGCTRWTLRHQYPTRPIFFLLVALFLIGQIVLELWFTHSSLKQTWRQTLEGAIQWGSFLQIALHIGAIYLGYWWTKRLRLREHAPAEMEV